MRSEVEELKCSMLDLGGQVKVLESQNMEHLKLNKSIISQMNYLERAYETPVKDVGGTVNCQNNSPNKYQASSSQSNKIKGSSRRKMSAITIERAGKVKHLLSSVN